MNQGRKNKSGLGLNLLIARSHQVATQLVGVQLSIANLLAIAVSAASVVAGTVTITMQRYPASWPLWVVAGVIGAGLALLIEGMTLGALIRIRLASKKIKTIDERLEAEQDQIAWFALDKSASRAKKRELRWKRARATKSFRKMRIWSTPIVIVGSITSAVAGGMFYHTVLSGLGQWESLVVAALFPFVVTCTFISSELFKDIQEEAIKEGYTGGGLADAALREETRRLSFQAVHDGILRHFHDPEIQQELKLGTMAILKDIIIDLRQTVSGTITAFKDVSVESQPQMLDSGYSEQQNGEQNELFPVIEPLQTATTSESWVASRDTSQETSDEIKTQEETQGFEPANIQTTGYIALDPELVKVLETYPKVSTVWLANNRKSATLEEVMEVTGHSKRRLGRAPLQRTSRNKELIRINSVLTWLKSAPEPSRKEDHAEGILSMEHVEQSETKAASNGHVQAAPPDDLAQWWVANESP